MNVLSLFDGMSCGMIALERAGIKVDNYFASEIDEAAIAVSKSNYPNIIRLGDVCDISYIGGKLYKRDELIFEGKIDLVIGGSPCQSISNMGDGSGLAGKSGLFYQFFRLLKDTNPAYFLLENVQGNKKALSEITRIMGVTPVKFNSNLVSAQNRNRLYWSNILYSLPEDKGISLVDILDNDLKETHTLKPGRYKWITEGKGLDCIQKRYASLDGHKSQCLTARGDASWNCQYVTRNGIVTKLSPEEWEKLQTVPVGYTKCASTKDRYKMLGNGWTVDVIAHIFGSIK